MKRPPHRRHQKTFPLLRQALQVGLICVALSTLTPMPWAEEITPIAELYKISREPNLVRALQALQSVEGEATIQTLQAHQAHILFMDLAQVGPAFAGNDALSLVNQNTGQQVIYISQRHQYAPAQALAALVKHESMHHDSENSLLEEACAWREEGLMWQHMKRRFPDLAKFPIKASPLVDRLNAIGILIESGTLSQEIAKNPAYLSLPITSPGFQANLD